ncbi:hypothetical protein PLGE761_15390 [Pluralibacter gergoviae]|nr:hypothetical protein AZ034_003257 [Pluralibacter gergoviae]OUF54379.1 hypothetical protein AZ044_000612 [Pluralibacter gergoviae]SUB71311.1 Uncharacterised protein [Pluralibacter gergoviae]
MRSKNLPIKRRLFHDQGRITMLTRFLNFVLRGRNHVELSAGSRSHRRRTYAGNNASNKPSYNRFDTFT